MPLEKDVPEIKSAYYDANNDSLEIVLKDGDVSSEKNIRDNVTLLYTQENKVVGIRIGNFKTLVVSHAKQLVLDHLNKANQINHFKVTDYRVNEIEKRKYSFFGEVLNNPRTAELVI